MKTITRAFDKTTIIGIKLVKFVEKNTLNQTIISIKKATKIIFEFHVGGKRILFVGLPNKAIKKKHKKKLKHSFIDRSLWVNGLITNRKTLKQQNIVKINQLLQLIQKPDLIIILDPVLDFNALKESRLSKIPVIIFNSNTIKNKLFGLKSDYEIPEILTNPWNWDHIFFNIIPTILKKNIKL